MLKCMPICRSRKQITDVHNAMMADIIVFIKSYDLTASISVVSNVNNYGIGDYKSSKIGDFVLMFGGDEHAPVLHITLEKDGIKLYNTEVENDGLEGAKVFISRMLKKSSRLHTATNGFGGALT